MAEFDYPSRYYADDKDMADILSEEFSLRSLLKIGFRKGICLSSELSKDAVVDQLRMLPFTWPELQALLESFETPENQDSKTTCKIETKASMEEVEKSVQAVKEERSGIFDEVYGIQVSGDRLFLTVRYTEIDRTQTRVIQHFRRTLEAIVELRSDGLQIEYPDNPLANKIVDRLIASLPVPQDTEPPKKETLSLAGASDPEKSTAFFIELMRSISGFSLQDVTDLRMHRPDADDDPNGEAVNGEGEGEAETEADERQREEVKGLVRDTTLSGRALLVAPQFQRFRDEGFCIVRASWIAREEGGEGRQAEFHAEFKTQGDRTFTFACRWVWQRDDAGELVKKKPNLAERNDFNRRLREAAYAAFDKVMATTGGAAPKPQEKV